MPVGPPHANPPRATQTTPTAVTVTTSFSVLGAGGDWKVTETHLLRAGSSHIEESLVFERKSGASGVRLRSAFHTLEAGLPTELQYSLFKGFSHGGWQVPGASFALVSR